MNIAVVTPVYQTPRPWLEQCLASVRGQTVPRTHVVVSDGDNSVTGADFPGVELIFLPQPHRDYGNRARAIGSFVAQSHDVDAIAYLDADDSFEADHLQQMVALHEQTGAAVCTAACNLVDLEGRFLGRGPEVDDDSYIAASSLFLTRAAFEVVLAWYRMPPALSSVSQRVLGGPSRI